MSGVGKSAKGAFKRATPFLKGSAKRVVNPYSALKDPKKDFKDLDDALNPGHALEDIEVAMAPDNSAMEALLAEQQAANNKPAMPMPDEEEIRRARRRAGGASRSGRASTIMSGGAGGQGLGG